MQKIIHFISILVVVLCCLLKIFGLSGVVFLLFSIIIILLTILMQILSTTSERSLKEEIYAERSNPLDDSYSRRVLGLSCEFYLIIIIIFFFAFSYLLFCFVCSLYMSHLICYIIHSF
jgi:hypothetical protein